MKKYLVVYNIVVDITSKNIEDEIYGEDKISIYFEAKKKMEKIIQEMETKSTFSIVLIEEIQK